MEDFGKRLKEERERLGLSQPAFGAACGVGKTAQYTYERGDREPSMSYLDAAAKLGVDIHYVLGATRVGNDWAYARAYKALLYAMEMLLGLEEGRLEKLCKQRVELEREGGPILDEKDEVVDLRAFGSGVWVDEVMRWLVTSTKPHRCLDLELFASVLAGIESHLGATSRSLTPEKKAESVVMLYRAFKASGVIDQEMIKSTVTLAS